MDAGPPDWDDRHVARIHPPLLPAKSHQRLVFPRRASRALAAFSSGLAKLITAFADAGHSVRCGRQFLLTSPCFFLAFDYAALPRLSLHLEADDCLWMRRTWIVKTFVWLDVLTFLAQLGGSGLQASTTHLALIGNKVSPLGSLLRPLLRGPDADPPATL
jgi:hypothetical protein